MKKWTPDDSVNAEIKFNSNSVKEFIEERFSGEDTFDFEKKNSFYFTSILREKFTLSQIWDDSNKAFYAGTIGDTIAVLYNIKGMEIITDPVRLIALEEFSYDSDLYETLSNYF